MTLAQARPHDACVSLVTVFADGFVYCIEIIAATLILTILTYPVVDLVVLLENVSAV